MFGKKEPSVLQHAAVTDHLDALPNGIYNASVWPSDAIQYKQEYFYVVLTTKDKPDDPCGWRYWYYLTPQQVDEYGDVQSGHQRYYMWSCNCGTKKDGFVRVESCGDSFWEHQRLYHHQERPDNDATLAKYHEMKAREKQREWESYLRKNHLPLDTPQPK